MLPKEIQNQYEILEELGRGGTAVVYKCVDKQSNQIVAVKIGFSSDDNSFDFSQLAAREYQLIGNYNFPGLVNILKNPKDTANAVVMELCLGKSLEQLGKIEDINIALNIFSAVAINFHYLRILGIEHGDVKPDNIFIPDDFERIKSDNLWFAKLSDFSLGKFNNESYEQRLGIGTLGYSAPETIAEKELSYLSDIFSYGVTLYQLLSGRHPFLEDDDDPDPVKINGRVQELEIPLLNDIRNDIPVELAELVHNCMSKDKKNRPKSWFEICRILSAIGATYPFQKVIKGKYLLTQNSIIEENIDAAFELSDNEKNRLCKLSNSKIDDLRLILSFNDLRENIDYSCEKVSFRNNILSPSLLVKRELDNFNKSSITDRKQIIKLVLIGKDGNIPDDLKLKSEHTISALLYDTLPYLISTATIKKLSKSLISKYKESLNNLSLVKLALQIGNIELIEQYGHDAAYELIKEDRTKDAVMLLEKLVNFAELTGQEFKIRNLIMLLADNLKNLGETDKSEKYYFKIIEIYKDHEPDPLLGETYKDLGDIYKMKHNVITGIEYLNKAIDIYNSLNREIDISNCLNNIGNLFWIKGDLKQAAVNYRKALKIQRKLNSIKHVASTLNNLGGIYIIRSKFSRGIKIMNISLKLKKEIGDKGEIARTLNNLGFTYYLIGENNKAVSVLQESLELNRQIESKNEILFNLENLSSIIIRAGRIKESINYLKEGTSLSKELNDIPHETIFILNTAKVLGLMGRVDQALNHFKQAEELKVNIDDFIIDSTYSLELALFYKALGDKVNSLKHAEISFEGSKRSGEEAALVESTLLKLSLDYNQELIDEIKKSTSKVEYKRASNLINFALLENKINNSEDDLGEDIYKDLLSEFDEDIESSRVHYLYGIYLYKNGKLEDAEQIFNLSLSKAKQIGIMVNQFKTLVYLGQIYFEWKEYEDCYNYFQDALKISRFLLENITNDDLRKSFSSLTEIQILSSRIKELKTKIKNG